MMRLLALLVLACVGTCWTWSSPRSAHAQGAPVSFEKARELERTGDEKGAFVAYLAIPGAEWAAARLGRLRAAEFLPLAQGQAKRGPGAILVEGDLLLALGRRSEALDCYRRVARRTAPGGEGDNVPAGAYLVEPTDAERARHAPALPFTVGPGSHRDNWLVRRFIALDAWDDAARELARVWEIHRALARRPLLEQAGPRVGKTETCAGFDGLALEFALDYAFFLERQKARERALAVLMEPLSLMDMDRNPNSVPGDTVRMVASRGISRKQFIRLAYGAFKSDGREDALCRALEGQVAAGRNAARRVLARIRRHQGREQDALALEFAYIRAGSYDEATAAYRSALIYEDARRPAEAAAAYERFVAAPYRPLLLPDRDEEDVENQMFRQVVTWHPDPSSPAGHRALVDDARQRLIRLYVALGQPARVDDVLLRQLEASPALLDDPDGLARMRQRLATVDARKRFTRILASGLSVAGPGTRASIHWVLGDPARAARALGEVARKRQSPPANSLAWKGRFDAIGKLRMLLEVLVASDPRDVVSHAELMDLRGPWPPLEGIPVLEAFLASEAVEFFRRGKGSTNPTRFRNAHDIAYRLMRLYEKTGQFDRIRDLGLRLVRGGKPFQAIDPGQHDYRDANELPEDVAACLALLVQHADAPALRAQLERLLLGRPWPWSAALAQLRRRAGAGTSGAPRPLGWANAPGKASVFTCQENVLSLAVDGCHIYAGHPWGVAVYTHAGRFVTRVALGEAAQDLLVHEKALWVVTPAGLFRIPTADATFRQVARVFLDRDLPARERGSTPSDLAAHNRACTLAADGPFIWIGTSRNVQRWDTRTGTLRVYLPEELGEVSPSEWTRFLMDGDVLWVDGEKGCRRYDRASDTWTAVAYQRQPVHLVALQDGILWGHVWLNDALRDRPCLVDRRTLQVTPVLIQEGNSSERCINGPFAFYGKWQGHAVLGPGNPDFYYDAAMCRLRPLPRAGDRPVDVQSDLPAGLRSGFAWRRPDGSVVCRDQVTSRHGLASGVSFFAGSWMAARLPGGDLVVGGTRERSPRYEYPQEDRPQAYETWDEEGGLYLVPTGGVAAGPRSGIRRISAVQGSDALPGDGVLAIAPSATGGLWVATSRGVARLDSARRAVERYTRGDGLCANQVRGIATLGGKVYLATGWGDSGGGLAVYDPTTRVLTSMGQADGMDTDNLEAVSVDGTRLRLVYATEYLRGQGSGDFMYRRFPAGSYDPASGRFTSGGRPALLTQSRAAATEPRPDGRGDPMPYLGGTVWKRGRLGGATVLCGTRGMVILEGGQAPSLVMADITPARVSSPLQQQMDEAQALLMGRSVNVDRLKVFLSQVNPYVRARALEECERPDLLARAEVLATIGAHVSDTSFRVRSTAVLLLARAVHQAADGTAGTSLAQSALRPLTMALRDSDFRIRAVAALALARLGDTVAVAQCEEILADARTWRTLPFGLRSERGVDADLEHVYRALAPHADSAIFGLLVRHPLPVDDYEPRVKILSQLGSSLRRHPEAASVLLAARGRDAVLFAQAVFARAGRTVLPALHQALESTDRVARSNAARGCGALRDPASTPLLMRAAALESGLSRASVVWALGELKAGEALPLLVAMYGDARADEERRRGAGYRSAQQTAVVASQYDNLRSLDGISADWDELKAAGASPRVDPVSTEDLMEPREILEAVRKVGPRASQVFYRSLAGDRHADARCEAATCLADASPADRAATIPILHGLLADTDVRVQMCAATSLLIVGETAVQPRIVEWLASPEEWNQREILAQLGRVSDPAVLAFARAPLAACARNASVPQARAAAEAILKRLK